MIAQLLPYVVGTAEWDKHIWTSETGPQLSASLLARLGEAADGKRDGKDTWLVGQLQHDYNKLHKVLGYYDSAKEAFEKNEKRFDVKDPTQDAYKIFGPFQTYPTGLKKEEPVIRVTIATTAREICLDGGKYDAIFWSESAFDKFLAPYYTHVAGVEQAAYLRTMFLGSEVVSAIHIPGSEIIEDSTAQPCVLKHLPTLGLHVVRTDSEKTGEDGVEVIPV